jgi:hypothetical protein
LADVEFQERAKIGYVLHRVCGYLLDYRSNDTAAFPIWCKVLDLVTCVTAPSRHATVELRLLPNEPAEIEIEIEIYSRLL